MSLYDDADATNDPDDQLDAPPNTSGLSDTVVEVLTLFRDRSEAWQKATFAIVHAISDNVLMAFADYAETPVGDMTVTDLAIVDNQLLVVSVLLEYDPRTTNSTLLQQYASEDVEEMKSGTKVQRLVQFTIPLAVVGESRENVRQFFARLPRVSDTDATDVANSPASNAATSSSAPAAPSPNRPTVTQFDLDALTDAQRAALAAYLPTAGGQVQ